MGDLGRALSFSICLSVAFAAGQDTKQILIYEPANCKDATNVAKDKFGSGCESYWEDPAECGNYDNDKFKAVKMCCACPGCNVVEKIRKLDGANQGTCYDGMTCYADGNCGCTVAGEVPIEQTNHEDYVKGTCKDTQKCYPPITAGQMGHCD